jgi:hypothetical protein
MVDQDLQTFRNGQQVRIIACPQNHPDHVGQVGTVAQKGKKTTTIRILVGMGICQATAAEVAPAEPAPAFVPARRPVPGTPNTSA